MRFAAMSTMIDLDRRLTHDRLLDTLREQAALADEVGLETIWLGEHHFGPYGAGNSPNAILVGAPRPAPPVTLKAGSVLFIPARTIDAARNVGSGARHVCR